MPVPTYIQFVQDYPEFGDPDLKGTVENWLDAADLMLTQRWDDTTTTAKGRTLRYIGASLFAAHNVTIQSRDMRAARNGGVPGVATSTGVGVVSAKTVDEVSISYDAQSAIALGAGHWNLTTYGTRFVAMARMVGAGGLQVGAHHNFINPLVPVPQGPAWWGVDVDIGWGWD